MKLYLVQHATAVPKEINSDRPLTEQGRHDTEKVAAFVKPLNIAVEYLWHSQKTRAAQTAEILSEVIEVKTAQAGRDGLARNDDVVPLSDELAALARDIMIVGHLPFLGKLASLLLTGSESANTVAFKNSGIVYLSCSEQSQWQVHWVITPELLA
ncbi:MAG: phosphohistidine phosphatase SixA [Planctomycetota bacterium]|jgi:phosphohistidine phosphatase